MSQLGSPKSQSRPASASDKDAGEDENLWRKTVSKLQGNARAVVFASRLNKATWERGTKLVGSLKSFVPEDILGNFKDWIEYPEGFEEDEVSTKWSEGFASLPQTPSQASSYRPGLLEPHTVLPEIVSPRSPGLSLPPQRRRLERVGDRLMRQRTDCPRHDQLKELVPQLPPDPPLLSRAARKAQAERRKQEADKARAEAEEQHRQARRGFAIARFRAAGFAILRKLRSGDEDFFTRLNSTAVLPMEKKNRGKQKDADLSKMPEDFDPFYHHLRHVRRRREELSPRQAAKRDELTKRGNFSPSFIADLAVKPRVEAQPLLAFMEQGDFMSTVEQKVDADSEHQLLSRRLRSLRAKEPRGDPNSPAEEVGAAKSARQRKLNTGATAPVKFAASTGKGSKMQRMLELLDPGKRAGYVVADALVPLMFWLGLTKSRTAALETLRMGFGSLQIDSGALLVMGEHVEVQMRLVEGLRHLIRRESLEQLCEYITGNNFQRLRAWFNSMRADQFGCVDITQVQSLFARMEVTTDRQTLFRLLSYIIENPHPTAAKDPREAMAIEKKKFSLQGFGSLICRCAASWVLHRVFRSILEAPEGASRRVLTEQDIAMRWIQLQRRIMISLMVNQRFWGRECRQVLGHLQPPQMSLEELGNLSPEQWNLLFQRVRAQGLASVLSDEETWS
ncbi:unnamed protein product [Durusdinium trenchii]|uniref:Uncharacterized protein n=2 Tax=Durusdinium trenchii TaxID=1381693 RepID=A0ABP0QTK2_9DINO